VVLVFEGRRGLLFYGDLRKAGTEFVPWRPRLCPDADVGRTWKAQRLWAECIDRGVIKYGKERHDDDNEPLILLARTATQRPVFKTSINIGLALRLALRRYLGIEPAALGCRMSTPARAQARPARAPPRRSRRGTPHRSRRGTPHR
jgi:hypothetical protein